MIKRLKKELHINVEEKDGHLFLGEKDKDMRLVMLRPNEIMEFCEFAGTNAEDILIWVGKSLGKIFIEKFFYNKDWSTENIAIKKEVVLKVAEAFQQDVGYGRARIDNQTRMELDLAIGDVIAIAGPKVTASVVWRAHPGECRPSATAVMCKLVRPLNSHPQRRTYCCT